VAGPGKSRAASGARLTGDDVQHLIVWYQVLQALRDDSGIEELAVEAADAGNVDDLTLLYMGDRPDEYWQIKASVDAATPFNESYFFDKKEGTQSLLQRLHSSWLALKERGKSKKPVIVFATTKVPDPKDPVFSKRATLDSRIHLVLQNDAVSRQRWAAHLGIGEGDLMDFLQNFTIRHGASEAEWREKVRDAAAPVHIQADPKGIGLAIQQVRDWVKSPRQTFSAQALKKVVADLDLVLPEKTGLVIVQMLEANPRAQTATYSLDLINMFDGVDPYSRRQLKDPGDVEKILAELGNARQKLRDNNIYDIEVEGPMRLPLWFLTGNQLGNTAGMSVKARTSQGMWSSTAQPSADVQLETVMPGAQELGRPLAVSINLATDITPDVNAYLQRNFPGTLHIPVALPRPWSRGITDAAHAQAIAFRVREEMRCIDRELHPSEVHLFLAMPGPMALLIGHVWDRLPPTTVYWDLGKTGADAYAPAFRIG